MKSELKGTDLGLNKKGTTAATLAGLLDYHGPVPSRVQHSAGLRWPES